MSTTACRRDARDPGMQARPMDRGCLACVFSNDCLGYYGFNDCATSVLYATTAGK
ncbi:MAG: hypothetical protein LBP59_05295 [Planctomycetaceae bacterium]|nr:hypothetical protein [Planctomycetaceae bacterium]